MENFASPQPSHTPTGARLFDAAETSKNQPYPQHFHSKQQLDYNPYSFYHQYWRPHNEYQFAHQYFNPHQNYWNQYYINEQRLLNQKEFNAPKQKKVQADLVKIQHQEQVQICQNVPQLRHPRRKYRLHKKNRKNNASYYWSSDQNKRYSDFLSTNSDLFGMSLSQKKNLRINVMMSKKVKSRTPQQCHSHHQKMMKKYGSIESIVEAMRNEREEYQKKNSQAIPENQAQDQVLKDQVKPSREFEL